MLIYEAHLSAVDALPVVSTSCVDIPDLLGVRTRGAVVAGEFFRGMAALTAIALSYDQKCKKNLTRHPPDNHPYLISTPHPRKDIIS